MLDYLWALPLTIVGYLYKLLCWKSRSLSFDGAKFYLVESHQPLNRIFKFLSNNKSAFTIGTLVYVMTDASRLEARLIRHELEHVRQNKILGIFFPAACLFSSFICLLKGQDWDKDNYFEIKAREAERN